MARGHVTERKQDIYSNPKGLANPNPILDTQDYIITFDDGNVTELTANLYVQCDPNRNQ